MVVQHAAIQPVSGPFSPLRTHPRPSSPRQSSDGQQAAKKPAGGASSRGRPYHVRRDSRRRRNGRMPTRSCTKSRTGMPLVEKGHRRCAPIEPKSRKGIAMAPPTSRPSQQCTKYTDTASPLRRHRDVAFTLLHDPKKKKKKKEGTASVSPITRLPGCPSAASAAPPGTRPISAHNRRDPHWPASAAASLPARRLSADPPFRDGTDGPELGGPGTFVHMLSLNVAS